MTTPTLQDALSELLAAQGFTAMARDVLTETDKNRLSHYGRIIVRSSRPDEKLRLAFTLRRAGLDI